MIDIQASHIVLISIVLQMRICTITLIGKAFMIREIPSIPVLLN